MRKRGRIALKHTTTGALLLFGAVQVTMISAGLWSGEKLHGWQVIGLLLAFAGLTGLMMPGLSAPPLLGSELMLAAGVAWGIARWDCTGHREKVTCPYDCSNNVQLHLDVCQVTNPSWEPP